MPMSYDQLLNYSMNLMVDQAPSADFSSIFPAAIQQAENDLYRTLDILSCRASDSTVTLTVSNRNATCPSTVSIVEGISYLTPVGNTPPTATRNGIERTSLDFIDQFYGDETATGTPLYFAMKSDTAIVFAPTPASAWKIEITGTVQPTAMSPSNQTSFLGNQFPDLLLAGVIVFMCAWQKDLGQSSDNPQLALSWQSTYDRLLKSAVEFVQRQKSQDAGWNPYSPTPLSTPRG